MAIKLVAIFSMLLGLVTYAHSAAVPDGGPTSISTYDSLVRRAGYLKIAETTQTAGLIVETFEYRVPTRPNFHRSARFKLISRAGRFIDVSHDLGAELPD